MSLVICGMQLRQGRVSYTHLLSDLITCFINSNQIVLCRCMVVIWPYTGLHRVNGSQRRGLHSLSSNFPVTSSHPVQFITIEDVCVCWGICTCVCMWVRNGAKTHFYCDNCRPQKCLVNKERSWKKEGETEDDDDDDDDGYHDYRWWIYFPFFSSVCLIATSLLG